jgi:hypothetical protein
MSDYVVACEIMSVAKRLGLTYIQLARASGFDRRTVARLRAGYDQQSAAAHNLLCFLYDEIIHRAVVERRSAK